MRVIVAITGASGAAYALRLLETLNSKTVSKPGSNSSGPHETALIISEQGMEVSKFELGKDALKLKKLATKVYDNSDLWADISSGSVKFDAMVIVPCSMSTLSKTATGISDNLITRAASVCLKERRKLIIVPRETPLSAIHLSNMHTLALAGAVILPAMPAFYNKPKTVDDMINFVTGKILDLLGIENKVYKRWKE